MGKSEIDWTDYSLNPGIYGCTEVSPACANCYAAGMAHRLVAMGVYPDGITEKRSSGVHWSGKVTVDYDQIEKAFAKLPKRKKARVFVTSMSDLFHKDVPFEFIDRVFFEMKTRPHLTFQVLTKRPERMSEFWKWYSIGDVPYVREWPRNVWAGCTVEDQKRADERIPHLLRVPAKVRFVSCEPLVGPLDLRRWVSYSPLHGGITQSRRGRLSSGGHGSFGDRSTRAGLEGGRVARKQVGPEEDTADMPAAEGGTRDGIWIPSGSDHAQRREVPRIGTPVGVFASSRKDTGEPDGEPRERNSVRQQTGEPHSDDLFGARDSRESSARHGRGQQSARDAKSSGKTHRTSGVGDQAAAERRGEAEIDRRGLRDRATDGFTDSERRPQISWLICGGESGSRSRPSNPQWFRSLRDQCASAGVAYFFKQWGAWVGAKELIGGREFARKGMVESHEWADGAPSIRSRRLIVDPKTLDGVKHQELPE